MTQKIYRIENEYGRGCFTTSIYDGGMNDFEEQLLKFRKKVNKNHKSYPAWFSDFDLHIYEMASSGKCNQYLSGCDSVESLKKWFKDFWDTLIQSDVYWLFEYEVPVEHVYLSRSGKQIIFNGDKLINKTKINL